MTYRNGAQFHCDECPEAIKAEGETFGEQMEFVKEMGWRAFKAGPEWRHACPSCVEDFASGKE